MTDPRETLNRIRRQADADASATVPALLDLADAVLERHVEGRTFYGHGFSQRMCECGASWPCPDYTAATTALERATDARA